MGGMRLCTLFTRRVPLLRRGQWLLLPLQAAAVLLLLLLVLLSAFLATSICVWVRVCGRARVCEWSADARLSAPCLQNTHWSRALVPTASAAAEAAAFEARALHAADVTPTRCTHVVCTTLRADLESF